MAFAALEVNVPTPEVIDSDLQLYLGDIVISVETAIRQARQRKHSLTTELAWLAAHGFLHLLDGIILTNRVGKKWSNSNYFCLMPWELLLRNKSLEKIDKIKGNF